MRPLETRGLSLMKETNHWNKFIFWAFINIELNASNIEKMGTSKLEAIVSPYCLPNGLNGCDIFHDGITWNDRAKICYLTQHELQVHVLLISGTSTRGWDVFLIRHKSFLGEVDDFFSHEKLSAKRGRNWRPGRGNIGDSASRFRML